MLDPVMVYCLCVFLSTDCFILQKKKDEGPPDLSKYADIIDPSTFEQILEMDDDSEREFSKGIVYGFFDQAETTFEKMDEAL
jgi:osomolarity two-component system phosphorelay intermediate protein YPD1